jgi:MoaA/NifB/PqqE/SkfB family radical SAM enzyme
VRSNSLLRFNIKNNGFKNRFKKSINPFTLRRLLRHYLDIIGVLDGSYAYKGPNFAQIDLTNDCNNDCIGCWCNSPLLEEKKINPDVKMQALPYKRVTRLIDELYRMGTRHIYYAGGGEPFMYPRIMDILAYTKKKGFECYVNTNFTLIDEKRVKELVDLGVDSLTVSVWAGTAGVYSVTHPNKGEDTFYQMREMLKLLNSVKRKFPIIKLYNVIFNMNYYEVEKMIEFALQTKSEMVEFTVMDTIPGKTDRLLLNDKERGILLEDCKRLKEKYDSPYFKDRIKLFGFEEFMRRISNVDAKVAEYDSNIIGTIPCYTSWVFVRILADGNVNSCLKSHRFPVGNILDQKFSEIWNGSLQRRFREKAFRFDKNDSFFSLIGNDPDSIMGCYKSCDNIGHNMYMHGKIASLSQFERNTLNCIKNIFKFVRNFQSNGKEKSDGDKLAEIC